MSLLLDSHAWAWSLDRDERLSRPARAAMDVAPELWISPASFYEIAHKTRLGKWPAMERHLARLAELAAEQGLRPAQASVEIMLRAATYDWPHRDPFDRIIAATAQILDLAVVSADTALDSVPGGLARVW